MIYQMVRARLLTLNVSRTGWFGKIWWSAEPVGDPVQGREH